jgi:NAD(P)-dependent dehydrogenase (short-subunit alcohol dehydrogenase family)
MATSGGRLAGKTAVVVGAGQTPGETIGNGRATAILFAREGARVLLVDRDEASVAETASMIAASTSSTTTSASATSKTVRLSTSPPRSGTGS